MSQGKKDEIIKCAQGLFDVVGVSGVYLILGLESRVSRNLDNFFVDPGDKWGFPGFAENFSPKMEIVMKKLCEAKIHAVQVQDTQIKFKQFAVDAGICEWGKNSLAVHPIFGPWLRFVIFRTNRKFGPKIISTCEFSSLGLPPESVFDKCHNCDDRCVKACPVSALQPFKIPDRKLCIAWQQLGEVTTDVLQRCDICLQACMPQRP